MARASCFTDADVSDLDPVFAQLAHAGERDPDLLADAEQYAQPFLPVGRHLYQQALGLEQDGKLDAAHSHYLRSAAVYRIARFPIVRGVNGRAAWDEGKRSYERAGALLSPPSRAVAVPFTRADTSAGDAAEPIQVYVRTPLGEPPVGGFPVVLFICGLDAYRTDNTPRTQAHVDRAT